MRSSDTASKKRTASAKPKRSQAKREPTEQDRRVAAARALIAEVDRLSGDEYTQRIAEPDVQAALELIGEANGNGRQRAADAETPLGELVDAGHEEADAA